MFLNNRCSSADEDCDDPGTKAVREKERRQANNVRERLVNTRSLKLFTYMHACFILLFKIEKIIKFIPFIVSSYLQLSTIIYYHLFISIIFFLFFKKKKK